MAEKIMNNKIKDVDRITSVRLSPLSVAQLESLQMYTGENATRLMVRAIEMYFHSFVKLGIKLKPVKSNTVLKKAQ